MPDFRRIFPSYQWEDAWLVNQIIQMPNIVGKEKLGFSNGVPPEEIKKDNEKVKKWINDNMNGCSCLICFVGENTYTSKWVKYELELARKQNMGRFLVYLDGMKDRNSNSCKRGVDPYKHHGIYSDNVSGYNIKSYSWLENDGKDNMSSWIEDAIERASS